MLTRHTFDQSPHEARKSRVNAREQNTFAVRFLIAQKECCTRSLTSYLVWYCATTTPGFMTWNFFFNAKRVHRIAFLDNRWSYGSDITKMSLEALSSLAAYCFEEIQKNVKIATHEILRHFLKVCSCYDDVWQMTSLQDNIFSSCVISKYFFTFLGSFNRLNIKAPKTD